MRGYKTMRNYICNLDTVSYDVDLWDKLYFLLSRNADEFV